MSPDIRSETAADLEAVREVNRPAFGGEDEARLVDDLREGGYGRVSMVAEQGGRVVGHVYFSELPIVTEGGRVEALSLAPLAVVPAHPRRGIGTLLVDEGPRAGRGSGHRIVIVLGHPEFYTRFGFSAKLAERRSMVAHVPEPRIVAR